jgi:hypothetical protein
MFDHSKTARPGNDGRLTSAGVEALVSHVASLPNITATEDRITDLLSTWDRLKDTPERFEWVGRMDLKDLELLALGLGRRSLSPNPIEKDLA